MAIKIQRQTASASSASPPSTLPYGELACDKTAVLYVGNSSNYPVKMMDENSYNQVGNPNLLDNTNFKNLVNQRGASSYSLDWKYSIDRWVLLGTYSVSNHTLTFDAGNQTSRFGLDAISYMRQGIEKTRCGHIYPICWDRRYCIFAQFCSRFYRCFTGLEYGTVLFCI